ncbi:MAG: DEAD/DEAH box helicase [Deltaproteobacteria bacterium]|nr:DEAD/DEAH box helicase [Deltaproteobacteria bacterium]
MFHPLIDIWFNTCVGAPTDVQIQTWPKIADGRHLLITAPTGSGKTMASFLFALNQLLTGQWKGGQTRVLYISPLKALNNDIQVNLLEPLAALRNLFESQNEPCFPVHVAVRSGDTPQSERRRMIGKPPEILITTPESLNLLLSSRSGQGMLTGIQCVILDEIHSVVGVKRGTHLITAVDRLVEFCGEFQRIALSATVAPLDTVAAFVGGYIIAASDRGTTYVPREMDIVQATDQRRYDFQIRFPLAAVDRESEESFLDVLAVELKKAVDKNRSTLIFTNSRKMCEKLTLKLNSGDHKPLAFSHHGSLSKEIRHEVEKKLKAGELKAIVATHSLELGIDIGFLDEVLLVQAPFSVASAMQRIGRAGHQVGQVSVAKLYPTHVRDFVESAVLSRAIAERAIEPVHPVMAPLDILSQVIISMVATDSRSIDDVYARLRASYPYHALEHRIFLLVLHMLAGRYGDSRIRELKPRVAINSETQTVAIRKGAQLQLFLSGGTIPDRGYYHIRHAETGARIGELDEEFVWEAHIGKVFTIGAQRWRIEKITHNDVFVRGGGGKGSEIPFWNAEQYGRDFFFSERILHFLYEMNTRLNEKAFETDLCQQYAMDELSATQLIAYCRRQKQITGASLPHRKHVVVEHIHRGPGGAPGNQVVIHTFWGGKINRPIAMALDAAFEAQYGQRIEVFGGNDAIALILPHSVTASELWSLIPPFKIESLLRHRLEGSGFFGARFREAAGRALLVTRNRAKERMPLWMIRLKTHRLMDTVMKYTDFPILLETWRTCLQDEFDLPGCHLLLEEIEKGDIVVSEVHSSTPSPMANGIAYNQVSDYMYRRDAQTVGAKSSLSEELLREVALNAGIRPAIPLAMIDAFEAKRQRLKTGYAPGDALELVEWVKERRVIPETEWDLLRAAVQNETTLWESVLCEASPRLLRVVIGQCAVICCRDDWHLIHTLLYASQKCHVRTLFNDGIRLLPFEKIISDDVSASTLISEILSFYGPHPSSFLHARLNVSRALVSAAMDELLDEESIIAGALIENESTMVVCDIQNYEALLRISRAAAQPVVETRPIAELAYFLAGWQGLIHRGDSAEDLFEKLEQLTGWVAPCGLWEREVLPARMNRYEPEWLDTVLTESDLGIFGSPKERCGFGFLDDARLTMPIAGDEQDMVTVDALFMESDALYDLLTLTMRTKKSAAAVTAELWDGFWKGLLSNSSFAVVRKGVLTKFATAEQLDKPLPHGRFARRRFSGHARRNTTLPYEGAWFRLPEVPTEEDIIEREEQRKERVRILLDRYGILFLELLQRESPLFQWKEIFRTLRLLELAGEIQSGYFFDGILGPQFISNRALHVFMRMRNGDELFWLHAQDPASLCGIQVAPLKSALPRRSDGTHLVYLGAQLALVSQKNGAALTIHVAPNHPRITELFAPLHNLLHRRFDSRSRISIDTINDEPAGQSAYLDALKVVFDVTVDYKGITLYRHF